MGCQPAPYHCLLAYPACAGQPQLPALATALRVLSTAARVYGLLLLAYNFTADPASRFLINVALRVGAMVAPGPQLLRLGSVAENSPLRPLWELLVVPIIPGLSLNILSWGVSALSRPALPHGAHGMMSTCHLLTHCHPRPRLQAILIAISFALQRLAEQL